MHIKCHQYLYLWQWCTAYHVNNLFDVDFLFLYISKVLIQLFHWSLHIYVYICFFFPFARHSDSLCWWFNNVNNGYKFTNKWHKFMLSMLIFQPSGVGVTHAMNILYSQDCWKMRNYIHNNISLSIVQYNKTSYCRSIGGFGTHSCKEYAYQGLKGGVGEVEDPNMMWSGLRIVFRVLTCKIFWKSLEMYHELW